MTRLEAIKLIRSGQTLIKVFDKEHYEVTRDVEVWLRYETICNFGRVKREDHERIGPIHLRLWSAPNPHWLHITPRQVLSFIKRNYQR